MKRATQTIHRWSYNIAEYIGKRESQIHANLIAATSKQMPPSVCSGENRQKSGVVEQCRGETVDDILTIVEVLACQTVLGRCCEIWSQCGDTAGQSSGKTTAGEGAQTGALTWKRRFTVTC